MGTGKSEARARISALEDAQEEDWLKENGLKAIDFKKKT